jgi:hypothetical protein
VVGVARPEAAHVALPGPTTPSQVPRGVRTLAGSLSGNPCEPCLPLAVPVDTTARGHIDQLLGRPVRCQLRHARRATPDRPDMRSRMCVLPDQPWCGASAVSEPSSEVRAQPSEPFPEVRAQRASKGHQRTRTTASREGRVRRDGCRCTHDRCPNSSARRRAAGAMSAAGGGGSVRPRNRQRVRRRCRDRPRRRRAARAVGWRRCPIG